MYQSVIVSIEQEMLHSLSNQQLEELHNVLTKYLSGTALDTNENEEDYVSLFLSAKRVEGCSEKTIKYYDSTIRNIVSKIGKSIKQVTTEDIRKYLDEYQSCNCVSKVTIDNIRRILSSFFTWLETEDYLLKNPVKRIHKVKTCKTVKETYTDEALELMRDNAECDRDLAIIDILASTGMRVGELVQLDKSDINYEDRECIVLGKGNKERKVYFDARTKIHLQRYLNSRSDDNPALFVTLQKPFERLQISGVEIRLRKLGRDLNINKVHPHKFRRTLATMAIDKGMPIEQVQQLLGHQSVDTTLQYAMVNQANVKTSHRKYIA